MARQAHGDEAVDAAMQAVKAHGADPALAQRIREAQHPYQELLNWQTIPLSSWNVA